jgi:FAD/FMN-containing dehydrogenase
MIWQFSLHKDSLRSDIQVLDSKTKKKLEAKIVAIVGAENVTTQETDAVLNAHDAWPLSEAKIRAGELLPLADLVVFPGTTDEVSEVLKIANAMKIPVTPVGGGAGTCGGTLPIYGGIQLDLKRMDTILQMNH